MTERERADLLASLDELCKLCPEMRFGQLIANLAVAARGTEPGRSGTWKTMSWGRP